MIKLKSESEIEIMKRGGDITSKVLSTLLEYVDIGVTLKSIDDLAEQEILKYGAQASFKTVDNYPYTTCINVNEGIVHGMPNDYKIKRGDIVSIDVGAYFEGFHTDLSYTLEVGSNEEESFLEVGKKALNKSISKCVAGNTIGDVSYAMQDEVEKMGYSVSQMLVGHGIGRRLHEDPYVPCLGVPGKGPKIKEGMVFAIEVIYQKGEPDLIESKDGWTLMTADRSLSALFEKTVAVTKKGNLVLTNF